MKTSRLAAIAVVALLSGLGWVLSANDTPDLERRLSPPSFQNWAGTDHLGRDILGRTVRAAATAATVALPAWIIATFFGTVLGLIAASTRVRVVSITIDWAIKVVFATPSFLLLVGLGAVLGRGMGAIFVVVLLVGWAFPARHARALAQDVLGAPFTRAALSMGFSSIDVARYVLAPACVRPVVAASGGLIVEVLALDLALTLFGFGPPPPSPTFGTLLSDGLRFYSTAPWTVLVPLGIICVMCLCFRSVIGGAGAALPILTTQRRR